MESTSAAKESGIYSADDLKSMESSGSLGSSKSEQSKKSVTSIYIDSSDEDTSDDE